MQCQKNTISIDNKICVCYIFTYMGIKERRTKILLALFLLSDVNFSYVGLTEGLQKAFDLSMNQKTKGSLTGLIKEGLIEKEATASAGKKDSSHVYRLTQKGFDELCLTFPVFRYLKETWDGKWRILSYEIPEKKRELRDKLRREVAGWGLGPWHRSFWLTPHPIIGNLKSLVSQKEEEQYIQAFEASHVFGNTDILIEKVWQKSALDKKYREVFKRWHDILSRDGEKIHKFERIVNEYVSIIRLDPGLPSELLGKGWIGYEAFNIFKEIRGILLTA